MEVTLVSEKIVCFLDEPAMKYECSSGTAMRRSNGRKTDALTKAAAHAPLSPCGRGAGGEGAVDQRQFVKTLRRDMTEAERGLWFHLRAHRFDGRKFRRQQALGPYVADFVHFAARLIVEADGGHHGESARDSTRDAWLASHGFRVLRFWNDEILQRTDAVLQAIAAALQEAASLRGPSPATGGEGRNQPRCRWSGKEHRAPCRIMDR